MNCRCYDYVGRVIHPQLRVVATSFFWGGGAVSFIYCQAEDFFFLARSTFFHIQSSLLTFFFCVFVYFVLSVTMISSSLPHPFLEKHSCMNITFPIAIQNGTCYFRKTILSFLRPKIRLSKIYYN